MFISTGGDTGYRNVKYKGASSPGDKLENGAVERGSERQQYYDEKKSNGLFYSACIVVAPLFLLFGIMFLVRQLLSADPVASISDNCALPTRLAIDKLVADNLPFIDFAGRLRFAAAHIILLMVCCVCIGWAVLAARNTFSLNKDKVHWFRGILGPWLLSSAVLVSALEGQFGPMVASAIKPFIHGIAQQACQKAMPVFEAYLTWHAHWGLRIVIASTTAILLAVALMAWRFDSNNIDGKWSRTFLLRGKKDALMTLFFLASALLVCGNIALSTTLDWSMNMAGAFKTDDPKDSAKFIALFDIEGLKVYSKAITTFGGALSSALLILMFVPAFLALTDDIETAARTHAAGDLHQDGQPNLRLECQIDASVAPQVLKVVAISPPIAPTLPSDAIAGMEMVNNWKKKHGLLMSFTDMSANFLAVAAPLLSSGLIDLSKAVLGGH